MRKCVLLLPAVAILVAALSLGAVSAAGDTLTAAQWRRRANALCVHANKRSNAVRREAFRGLKRDEQPSLAQITAYVEGVAPIVKDLAHDLDALHEPEQLSKKVHRLVATARRELRRLVADPSVGLEGNPFSDTNLRSDALGLKSCS
jgi:hypothetical protein